MNLSSSSKDFEENGFLIAKKVIPPSIINQLKEGIFKNIKKCSKELRVSEGDYLSAVSRWAAPSPVTSSLPSSLLSTLTKAAQEIVRESPQLNKINVICKNAYCKGAVPYHQDIAYSPKEPYQFSAWLALHDITDNSSPLEVIPKSHLGSIAPAIDFWSPEFVPDLSLKKDVKKLLLSPGDVVFFDSRLWHGSSEKKDLAPRYALVTRWSSKSWAPNQFIPPIAPKFFGMWTSGQRTQEILNQALQVFFNKKEDDFIKLIEIWIEALKNTIFPFYFHTERAIESLTKIKILHLAFVKHNGGDATGTLYKNLWNNLLLPMTEYLTKFKKKNGLQKIPQKRIKGTRIFLKK